MSETVNLEYIIGGVAFVVLTAVIFWLFTLSSRVRQLTEKVNQNSKSGQEQQEVIFSEINALRKECQSLQSQIKQAYSGIEQKDKSTQSLLNQLQNNQQQQLELITELNNKVLLLEQDNEPNRLYSRAKKMVELGADIDEIVMECELSRAEAELLLAMQRQSKSKSA
ncbi:DUF2802 domain-containing protein [Psychrosphaera ytuae]|uniref:DUF2802 domain-containing protein n=1 Tax=Psychrosphaera ytuae TaxID=2820710 RepID=A0A975DBG5_9GAMM|nr:DUF2802 domain-containing protein [Psychrosphaera ytuae]QTH63788.1 DUF2802 domain-containing protein [Psychrosphaera ytuae]